MPTLLRNKFTKPIRSNHILFFAVWHVCLDFLSNSTFQNTNWEQTYNFPNTILQIKAFATKWPSYDPSAVTYLVLVYRVDFPWAGWCCWSSHGSSACRRTSQGYQNCWYSSARHHWSTRLRLPSIRRRPVPDPGCPRYTSEHNWRHTAAGSLYWASGGALVRWKEHKNRDEVFHLLCI